MQTILITIGAFIISYFFTGSSTGGFIAALAAMLFFFTQKINKVESDIAQIKKALNLKPENLKTKDKEKQPSSSQVTSKIKNTDNDWANPVSRHTVKEEPTATEKPQFAPTESKPSKFEDLLNTVTKLIKSYFTDGNLFVRIGILVLFFGVAFLLKYAAEHSKLPIEVRFIAVAIGGLALMGAGWRLRHKKTTYALLLQGTGIGIIYITIFTAYRLQNLLPSSLTFALLAVFSIVSALLAIFQNSRALAAFGILGGFLAPLLASSGSGNYIALFSYYVILDLAILVMAWYKSWRSLNLIGFIFTFGIFAIWVFKDYQQFMLATAELFLIIFFVIYSVIGVLYALRQPINLKGYVDGTLVFGTPLIVSSLQMVMMRHTDYGIAISAVGFGVYYIALARFLWQRHGDGLRLMAESTLSIGVIFITLAIPYALDGHWSAAAWALEAAGILWIAIKQDRKYTQYFALILQLGAGALFLIRSANDLGTMAFINPAFLGGVFLALGGLISAWQLYKLYNNQPDSLAGRAHLFFFSWGLLWWLASALQQIEKYYDMTSAGTISLFVITAYIFMYLSIQRKWDWKPAEVAAMFLIPALFVVGANSLILYQHALFMPDVFFWVAAMAISYYILYQLELSDIDPRAFEWLYWSWTMLLSILLSVELSWRFSHVAVEAGNSWHGSMIAVIPLLVMYFVHRTKWGALARFSSPLKFMIIVGLGIAATLWSININFTNSGETTPIPYLPLANPIDLLHILYLFFISYFILSLDSKNKFKYIIIAVAGIVAFIWINSILLRGFHHYLNISYEAKSMIDSISVQIGLSILWTILGSIAMLFASRKGMRTLWIIGGSLVGIVLIKMISVDLGASGTLERVISFIIVGSVLVGMGYFSPIPVKNDK